MITRKKIKPKERLFLFRRYDFSCNMCGLRFDNNKYYDGKNTLCKDGKWLEIDHIKPISKGGSDDIKNKQILCNVCNSKKGNKYG